MNHLYIAAGLIEAAGLAESGVNLFVGTMPHDVSEGVMLKDPLVGAEIDEGQDGFYDHHFLVIVRSVDPKAGYELARNVSLALNIRRQVVDGMFILTMNPKALPVTYPKGDGDAVETSVRMHVAFGEISS